MALQREQIVQTAEKFVARGKIEPAIKEYRKLLTENPNDINTLNRVGDLYARIQRIDEAVDFFTQIAEQYTAEGFFVKAIAIYKKIIKLDPTRLEVYEQLAELYHKQGLVTEARTQYQVLADYYQKHANAASAIAIYQKMAQLEPDNPTYHVKLAEIYHQQQLVEKAMGEYRIIAELMIKHGRPQEAAQVYERALDIDSQNLPFITDAVLKLREAGNSAGAAHFLAIATERNPQAERLVRMARVEERPAAAGMAAMAAADEVEAEEEASPPPARPRPVPVARPAETVEIEEEEEPDLALDDDLSRAMAEAAAAVGGDASSGRAEIEDEESGEIELDLDDMFQIDLPDEEEEPTSLVKPPADLMEAPRRPAWAQEAVPEAKAQPEPEENLGEIELDLEEGLAELGDLDSLGLENPFAVRDSSATLPLSARVEPAPEPTPEPATGEDLLERTATDLQREREEDLVTEAEVLAKYGLQDKAVERLEEALRMRPDHLSACALLIQLHQEGGRHAEVVELANRMSEAAARGPGRDQWLRVRKRLVGAGYQMDGEHVVAIPGAAPAPPPPAPPPPEPALPAQQPREVAGLAPQEWEAGLPALEWEAEPLLPPLDAEPPAAVEEALLPSFEAGPAAAEPVSPSPPSAPPIEAAPPSPAPSPGAAEPAPRRPPTAPKAARADKVDDLLRGLLGTSTKTPKAPAPPAAIAAPAAPPLPAPAPVAPVASTAPAPPPAAKSAPSAAVFNPLQIGELVESLDLSDPDALSAGHASDLLVDIPPLRPVPPVGPAAFPPLSVSTGVGVNHSPLDDTGDMSWLDEAEPPEPTSAADLFDEEDDFFDLAGELVEELSREEVFQRDGMLVQSEQTLEEIVEGFKKGVAEHLSPTDYDTHFNLGIAYREMGLLDEAIGEFQLASKDSRYLVLCCSMLGLCFVDKGLPELAIKWYRRALDFPAIGEEDHLGMMYDLGNVYMSMGDDTNAYKTFVDLYGIDTSYRDVVAKLEELGRPR